MVDQQKEQEKLLTYVALVAIAHPAQVCTTTNLSALETANEKSLEIENWMIDETYFGSNAVTNPVEPEESLEIEDWMTDDHFWNF